MAKRPKLEHFLRGPGTYAKAHSPDPGGYRIKPYWSDLVQDRLAANRPVLQRRRLGVDCSKGTGFSPGAGNREHQVADSSGGTGYKRSLGPAYQEVLGR